MARPDRLGQGGSVGVAPLIPGWTKEKGLEHFHYNKDQTWQQAVFLFWHSWSFSKFTLQLQKVGFSMWDQGAPSRKKKNAQDQAFTTCVLPFWANKIDKMVAFRAICVTTWVLPWSKQVVTSCTGLHLLLPPKGAHGVEGPPLWVRSTSSHPEIIWTLKTFGGFLFSGSEMFMVKRLELFARGERFLQLLVSQICSSILSEGSPP